MEVQYSNPGLRYMIDGIMKFQTDETDNLWREPLFSVYPQLNRDYFDSLTLDKRDEYIYGVMQEIYENEKQIISDKLLKYNEHWAINKIKVEEVFSTAFNIDCYNNFNNIIGNISLNPIEPRYLDRHTFDVFYLNGPSGAMGTALHEIIHFVWFYVWQHHFHDTSAEYEAPHLKWVFSEMVVDPIMRSDNRLIELNPYFDEGCAYEYFYKMAINGKPILDTLYSMYKKLDILSFMEQGYEYCVSNEAEIRAQMT